MKHWCDATEVSTVWPQASGTGLARGKGKCLTPQPL
jgi:hypothetical protein